MIEVGALQSSEIRRRTELDHLHFGKSFWRRMFSVPPLSARELRKLHESYKKATDRRIFISPSTMAKSLGTLSKSFETSDKLLWIQRKNRIPLSPPVFLLSSTCRLVIPVLIPTSRGHRWPTEKSPSPKESKHTIVVVRLSELAVIKQWSPMRK